MEAGRGGIWAVPLLTPLTSQVVSDTSEASATARQTAATAWRQVICSGKGGLREAWRMAKEREEGAHTWVYHAC